MTVRTSSSILVLTVACFAYGALACTGGAREENPGGGSASGDPEVWEGDVVEATRALRPQEGTERDWEVFKATVDMAWNQGLDTLPMGQTVVRIGSTFVGSPYTPQTLEVAGPEAVVVNLVEFDCVTLVENALALARFVKIHDPGILESETRAREAFRDLMREIRYRDARVDGYPSRLHYFSDWISDNEKKGLVRELTSDLGGVVDPRAIDFMTTHPEAYRQLSNPVNVAAMRTIEDDLSRLIRYRIPQEDIPVRASMIQDGDIIAATSTVEGLDVAHTGLAIWQDGELFLLHAPLLGDSVEVSSLPLEDRILRIESQDGIRVVRPLGTRPADPGSASGSSSHGYSPDGQRR